MNYTSDPATGEPMTMPEYELLEMARRHGVRWHYVPAYPAQLLIWGGCGPTAAQIVEALRSRCEGLSRFLEAHRPAWPPIPHEELGYRRDVLNEPDLRTGDLPLSVLKAMVMGWYLDARECERATEEWERDIFGRDAAVQP